MFPTDLPEFKECLRDAREAVGQGDAYTDSALEMMFASLAEFSLQEIQQALVDHISSKDGRWRPNAAYIREQIGRRRGAAWVSADEAWGQVPKLESDAGLLNQVTAAALASAQELIDDGDMIAARRTFIDTYSRLVEAAKAHPDPAQRHPRTWVSGNGQPKRFQDTHGERQMLLERASSTGVLAISGKQFQAPAQLAQLGYSRPPAGALEALKQFKPKELPAPEAQDYWIKP